MKHSVKIGWDRVIAKDLTEAIALSKEAYTVFMITEGNATLWGMQIPAYGLMDADWMSKAQELMLTHPVEQIVAVRRR